jgi:hypothetical protein
MNENICQLRIDFNTFVITGPSTSSVPESIHQMGEIPLVAINGDQESNWRSNCLLDSFSISGKSSANNPPTICGTNSGYHMYVDSSEQCNQMTFQFSAMPGPAPALGSPDTRGLATLANRDWDMTIYQIECGATWQAPMGCTQYQWGPLTGVVTSYNHQGGWHLANQNQKICIRRERGYCYACFAQDANVINFQIAGRADVVNHYTFPGGACGWVCEGANGIGADTNKCGAYDCAIIPGAFTVAAQTTGIIGTTNAANIRTLLTATYQTPTGPQISGNGSFGAGVTIDLTIGFTPAGTTTKFTICTKHDPFFFAFKSDGFEGTGEEAEFSNASENVALTSTTTVANTGVKINYELISCA